MRWLTPLRFVAALWVAVFHLGTRFVEDHIPILGSVRLLGYVGVTFFFVLSGFILAYNYGEAAHAEESHAEESHAKDSLSNPSSEEPALSETENRRRFPWRAYAVARFARVYPIYLVGMALAFPTYLAYMNANFGGVGAWDIVTRLLLLQAWFPAKVSQWNVASWSLSAEFFFYLVFPFVLLRLQSHCQSGLRTILGLVAIAALVPAFVFMNTGGVVGHVGTALPGHNFLKFNPLLRLPDFVFGVVLGLYFLREQAAHSPKPIPPRWIGLAGAGVVALLVSMHSHIGWAYLHNGLFVVPFGAIIYAVAKSRKEAGPARLLQRLGEASYAMYMIHLPLYNWATPLRRWLGPSDTWFFPVVLGLTVVTSVLLFYVLEQPLRRWIRRLA